MPIAKNERISGTIYVIARDADTAFSKALTYLGDKNRNFKVFETEAEADREISNRYAGNDEDDLVYAVALDVRPTGT